MTTNPPHSTCWALWAEEQNQNRARALRGEKLLSCRATELKTPPQPWGVATRTGGRDRGNRSQPTPPSPWAGPRAALRSGSGTIQPERTALQSRGRPSGAAAARAPRADAAERPERRPDRSERRGFFSPGSESTGAALERIDRSGRRSGRGGDGASWTRAGFSGGAGERPRGRTMGRRGKRRGFSRRMGLGFSVAMGGGPAPGAMSRCSPSLCSAQDK